LRPGVGQGGQGLGAVGADGEAKAAHLFQGEAGDGAHVGVVVHVEEVGEVGHGVRV